MYLLLLFAVLILSYAFSALFLLSAKTIAPGNSGKNVKVTVLIAVRDEEASLKHCLNSLENQDYPKELYSVCIVNDRSSDSTEDIIDDFVSRNSQFRAINILMDEKGLKGKMNALSQALDTIESEIILITDGDCIVPKTWVSTYVGYFDNNTALVGGMTLLEPNSEKTKDFFKPSLFGRIQALDWLFIQIISAKASHRNKPISVLGNNFGFRKTAYDEVGGYKSIGFSVTEDFALMRAIEKTGRWIIKHSIDSKNAIFSFPVKGFKEFFQQRLRWIRGGKHARKFTYLLSGQAFLLHILFLLNLIFNIASPVFYILAFLLISLDYTILKPFLTLFKLKHLKPYIIPFKLFYVLYTILFFLSIPFIRKTTWKGRTF